MVFAREGYLEKFWNKQFQKLLFCAKRDIIFLSHDAKSPFKEFWLPKIFLYNENVYHDINGNFFLLYEKLRSGALQKINSLQESWRALPKKNSEVSRKIGQFEGSSNVIRNQKKYCNSKLFGSFLLTPLHFPPRPLI